MPLTWYVDNEYVLLTFKYCLTFAYLFNAVYMSIRNSYSLQSVCSVRYGVKKYKSRRHITLWHYFVKILVIVNAITHLWCYIKSLLCSAF